MPVPNLGTYAMWFEYSLQSLKKKIAFIAIVVKCPDDVMLVIPLVSPVAYNKMNQ